MKWLIDDAKNIWRFWSVRIQMACAFLTGWLWIDPVSMLGAWNMMPHPVRELLPSGFLRAIGVVLFIMSILTIAARPVRQKKLEKRDGN